MSFVNYSRTPFFQRIYKRFALKPQWWGLSLKSCNPDSVKTFNSVRKRLTRRCFSVNFEKFLEMLFCRALPSNHFSHVISLLFADQWDSQPKINSFGVAMINQGKEYSQACSILCSYGNQVGTSLSSCRHTCTHLGTLIAGGVEKWKKWNAC